MSGLTESEVGGGIGCSILCAKNIPERGFLLGTSHRSIVLVIHIGGSGTVQARERIGCGRRGQAESKGTGLRGLKAKASSTTATIVWWEGLTCAERETIDTSKSLLRLLLLLRLR